MQLIQELFERIDDTTSTFVTDFAQRIIVEITPIITAALTLSFVIYGVMIGMGQIQTPVTNFLKKSFFIAIIFTLAITSGLYQGTIADIITSTPDTFAAALLQSTETGNAAAIIIDSAAKEGFDVAALAFDKVGFSGKGIAYAFIAILCIAMTALLVAIGGALLILAKVSLAILAGFGPLFIILLLFKSTTKFFELWLGQIINYGLVIVLIASIFGLMISIFTDFVSQINFDSNVNISYAIGGLSVLAIIDIIILWRLPEMASSLAGGTAMGGLHEIKELTKSAGNGLYSRGQMMPDGKGGGTRGPSTGLVPSMGSAGASAGRGAMNVARKASGYFKK